MKESPKRRYFDNNATTALASDALAAMSPYLREIHANPSSPCEEGRMAAAALGKAREQVAELARCRPPEVVFTSGGTESNSTALWSACRSKPDRRKVVVSGIEHASVLRCAGQLSREGRNITLLAPGREGCIRIGDLEAAIDKDTAVVSVMTANNETGALQPVAEAAELAHRVGSLFHTDAVQAAGKIPLDGCAAADFVSVSSHKIHGPKGAGALVVRSGVPFEPLLVGGDQERSRRAGTENVAGVAGFGAAAEAAHRALERMSDTVRVFRDSIEQLILSALPGTIVAGAGALRLPNTTFLLIPAVDTEPLLALLDMEGLCCSSGSACAAGAHEPSHVLKAMGLPTGAGWGSLRISLSRLTTQQDADYLVERVVHVVHHLRAAGASC